MPGGPRIRPIEMNIRPKIPDLRSLDETMRVEEHGGTENVYEVAGGQHVSLLDTVVEMQPSTSAFNYHNVNTQLITPISRTVDYTPLVVSSGITACLVLGSGYALISNHSNILNRGVTLMLACTIAMLVFNALLGIRVWRQLHEIEEEQYQTYIAHLSTHSHEPHINCFLKRQHRARQKRDPMLV